MALPKPIKVLVVEGDSRLREALVHLLTADPDIHVVGTAGTGVAALALLSSIEVHVILMDVDLPGQAGYETARTIMETAPLPIVACANPSRQDIASVQLTEMGAVAVVEKPGDPGTPGFDSVAQRLIQTVKLMSEVKVVRRWRKTTPASTMRAGGSQARSTARLPAGTRYVAIGASTGGPPVLRDILSALPRDFPAPILIVQHISPGFLDSLVHWLGLTSGPQVCIARSGQVPLPGNAYFAPDGAHLCVLPDGALFLSAAPAEGGIRPCVGHLFRSLALSFAPSTIGVVLTGMGKDGASDLKTLRDKGAFTIAQDRETSIVYGMPGEAVRIGAASIVLPSDKIASALLGHVYQQSNQGIQL